MRFAVVTLLNDDPTGPRLKDWPLFLDEPEVYSLAEEIDRLENLPFLWDNDPTLIDDEWDEETA